MMHVVLMHNEVSATPTVDEQDVLFQCDAVERALTVLGHTFVRFSLNLNLDAAARFLQQQKPDLIFNLVESFQGTDRLMPLAPLLFESMEIPYTGSSSHAILVSSGKISAKRRLLSYQLPTPAWMTPDDLDWNGVRPERAILKAAWEHASFGIADDSIVDCRVVTDREILDRLKRLEDSTGKQHFAEQFVEGREINQTLLIDGIQPALMPPAEILFVDYPEDKPKIVGYAAKWHENTLEYTNTPRTFEFSSEDELMLSRVRDLSLRCWDCFGLSGYARVDFRVDSKHQPWILEVNANPCIADDAGFAAAIEQGNVPYVEAVRRIVAEAIRRGRSPRGFSA